MDTLPLTSPVRAPLRAVVAGLIAALALAGCAATDGSRRSDSPQGTAMPITALRVTEHRGSDDLLTAGLGLAGLRSPVAPAFADPAHPTAAELRRRAIWSNWRGIADLAPGGGYGEWYGSTANVPGREFSALATVPGAKQPHRVLLQLPDAFDADKPCVVVAASSGSRGIYGAIAVAGPWALPKGCAVAYTDKGAGTDYSDLDAGQGIAPDGTVADAAATLAFKPQAAAGARGIAMKHAHSQDNPEADWGRHVQQAAQFALHALNEAYPGRGFDFANTRVIAVGISNGGGAVLRAAELDGAGWLDAVVAGEPEVEVEGARPLYDFATEAALLMPCALLDLDGLPASPLSAPARALAPARCASLANAGVLPAGDTKTQARAAHAALRASGWSEDALRSGALSVDFDLWRAIAVTYASAYGRYAPGEHPCGFAFAAQNPDFSPRAASDAERAAWWADGSGIAPGAGVGIVDTKLAAPDFTYAGLECLRRLWTGDGADAARVRRGIAELRAGVPRADLPVAVIHGTDDGLVPIAFSSQPWVAQARAAGRDVRYWQVRHAQHFDAFLALPDYRARYVPLLPYVYAALDRVMAHLDDPAQPLPASAVIETAPAAAPLSAGQLAIPR
ncbi:3-hydroxybutyrate oligomer hydrolase family protein [Lysobacter yangpyeongensis]|uniref:3-hydroxybutyrate oligomer hydrolase family protein n=1 Tax=Lysobacter yangpyeongensis TaxID=346182 RepID=A0ABW0SQ96_9GAMM